MDSFFTYKKLSTFTFQSTANSKSTKTEIGHKETNRVCIDKDKCDSIM